MYDTKLTKPKKKSKTNFVQNIEKVAGEFYSDTFHKHTVMCVRPPRAHL